MLICEPYRWRNSIVIYGLEPDTHVTEQEPAVARKSRFAILGRFHSQRVRLFSRRLSAGPQGWATILFQFAVFVAGFLIVFSRRPDAILNAQFWAEDGKYWYADAYSFGWHSLVMPEAGYLHLLPRLAALLSLLFPLAIAPLVMNLCAIVFQIFPVNLFLSSRFGSIALETRLFSCLLYLAVPNSFEIHANATNIQWHFALIGCMVLLSQPQINLTVGRQIFDLAALALVSLDSPVGMLLIPIAGIVWWQRKDNPSKWSILALI